MVVAVVGGAARMVVVVAIVVAVVGGGARVVVVSAVGLHAAATIALASITKIQRALAKSILLLSCDESHPHHMNDPDDGIKVVFTDDFAIYEQRRRAIPIGSNASGKAYDDMVCLDVPRQSATFDHSGGGLHVMNDTVKPHNLETNHLTASEAVR